MHTAAADPGSLLSPPRSRPGPAALHAPSTSTSAPSTSGEDSPRTARRWWTATFALVLGALALRILYLAFFCPYTLVEDEAFYWEWSRRLGPSYYSKGPGVAWTIAASTRALGDTAFAVRLPATLFGAATALLLAGLAWDTGGRTPRAARAGFLAAAAFLLMPMFQVAALLMTIDGPYAACWAAAAWAGWRALARDSTRAAVLLGAAIGVGFLYKYTILLLLPGLALFVLTRPRAARRGARLRLLLAACIAAVAFTPVITWNARHGWPTVAHLLGHLGVKGGDKPVVQGGGQGWHYSPAWTLEFIAGQFGVVGPLLVLMLIAGAAAWRTRRDRPDTWPADAYLLACALPLLVFYLLVSLATSPQGNWALASYLTGVVLGARYVECVLTSPARQPAAALKWTRGLWRASIAVGVIVALVMPRLDLAHAAVQPLYERLAGGPRRPLIPIGRFTGADRMGLDAARLLDQLRRDTGQEPFICATHYGRAAHLAFYTPGHPTVYCTSAFMLSGRPSQYDYWPDTDLRRASALRSHPALLVGGGHAEDWAPFFERVDLAGTLDGDGKPDRPAYLGYGFRGIPAPPGEQP